MLRTTVHRPAVIIGAFLMILLGSWSLAMPLMSSPDEPSHVIKAAAVTRGQLGGELGEAPKDTSVPGAPTWVLVPNDVAAADPYPNCFRFEDEDDASCIDDLPPREQESTVAPTYAGQYPPLYYALVGWPSLLLSGEAGMYAMRLVSAALCTAFLTAGAVTLRNLAPRRWQWGVWLALTPMALFIGGAVNPQALEITAAFSFWAAGLALVRPRVAGPPSTRLVVQLVVSGAVLVLVRTTGPVWALLAAVTLVVAARPGVLPAFVRSRQGLAATGAAVVSAVLALAWIVTHPDIVTTSGLFPEYREPRLVAFVMLLAQPAFVEQMTGNFGWLDTEAPYVTVLAWLLGVGGLLALFVVERVPNRVRAAVALAGAAFVVVPIALTIPTAEAAGIIWQGRYALPLAVGIPLLAATALQGRTQPVRSLLDRFTVLTLVLLAGGHAAAFYWGARRYAEGADGLWATFSPRWSSPIGFLPAVAAYAVVVGLAAWLTVRDLRSTAADADASPAAEDVPPVRADTSDARPAGRARTTPLDGDTAARSADVPAVRPADAARSGRHGARRVRPSGAAEPTATA